MKNGLLDMANLYVRAQTIYGCEVNKDVFQNNAK
jgi:hypothetical protein